MKKLSLVLCTCAALSGSAFAGGAHSHDTLSYYVGTQYNIPVAVYTDLPGGKSSTKQSFPNIDVAAGVKFGDHLRFEVAPGYRSFRYKTSYSDGVGDTTVNKIDKLSLYKIMLNGYIDGPKLYDLFTPYVMAGAGYAHITKSKFRDEHTELGVTNPTSTAISGSNFAWQSGVGVSTALAESLSMDIGVVYASYGRIKFADSEVTNGTSSSKLQDIEAFIGFRYSF